MRSWIVIYRYIYIYSSTWWVDLDLSVSFAHKHDGKIVDSVFDSQQTIEDRYVKLERREKKGGSVRGRNLVSIQMRNRIDNIPVGICSDCTNVEKV